MLTPSGAGHDAAVFANEGILCAMLFIRNQPEHAAVCFLVGEFFRANVLFYEDQEVSPDFAQKIKAQLLSYMRALEVALLTDDDRALIAALNDVVVLYAGSQGVI